MEKVPRETGDLLVEWREQRGMSQTLLAGKLGASPEYLGMIEMGKRRPGKTLASRVQFLTAITWVV